MKIAYCSDLHLEFGDIDLKNTDNADVLVLAGDIMISEYLHEYQYEDTPPYSSPLDESKWGLTKVLSYRFRDFMGRINKEFLKVIVIAGNHEFYNGKWFATLDYLREEYGKYSNIRFLENDHIILNNILFVGGTLWTDMNKLDPITMEGIKYMMNDFRIIKNDHQKYRKLRPEETVIRHRTTLDYISRVADENKDKKVVVVGHHSPSKLSIHPKYKEDREMNGGYSTDLDKFIVDRPQIKLWMHGHTHESFDYNIEGTRVLCNPRGYYQREESAKNFKLKYVEV